MGARLSRLECAALREETARRSNGLMLDGAGLGAHSVWFVSPGGSLTIENCVARGFTRADSVGNQQGVTPGGVAHRISNTTAKRPGTRAIAPIRSAPAPHLDKKNPRLRRPSAEG